MFCLPESLSILDLSLYTLDYLCFLVLPFVLFSFAYFGLSLHADSPYMPGDHW